MGVLRDVFASVPRKTADEYTVLHVNHTRGYEQPDEEYERYLKLRDELPAGARKEIERQAG